MSSVESLRSSKGSQIIGVVHKDRWHVNVVQNSASKTTQNDVHPKPMFLTCQKVDDFLNQSYGTSLNQGSFVGFLLVLKVDQRRKNQRRKKLKTITRLRNTFEKNL
jgi:hypothetical protein